MGKKKEKEPAEDPAMTRVRALVDETGISLVELGRRMGYGEDTARQSAWQFMKSRDPRMSMLRRFADAMGVPVDRLTQKGKRNVKKLEIELEECGCNLTRPQFHELLERVRDSHYPLRTPDDLVCHPDEAKAYCELVRTETGCPKLSDYLVLRTLLNARKATH